MIDQNPTKEELVSEISRLRRRVTELESLLAEASSRTVSAGKVITQATDDSVLTVNSEAFTMMFQGHDAVMYIVDLSTFAIIDANQAALTFYGYDFETMLTKRIPDLNITPEPEIRAEVKRAVNEGRSYYLFKHKLASGEIRDVEVYANPISIEGKEYSFSIVHDITDRKRAEEDLSQIFSMSLDMICIADINTATFIKVNPAFTEMLGHSEEALLEKPFLDLVHPDDIDSTRKVIEQKLQSGAKVINFENRFRCLDGSYRWLSWFSHPNPKKGVTYAIARDITEWKNNQEALKKSKALLDATGRMARVGGWELDADTMEVTWTEETYRIHEIPLDHKPPLREAINFFHPEDRPKLEQAIQRALNYCEPYDLEMQFITAQGKHLWARTICQPEIVNGKTVKLKGTFQDITARKKAEKALRENEAMMRSIFRASPIGIGLVSNRILLDVNDRICEITQFSREELIGQNARIFYPTDDDYEFVGTEKYRQIRESGTGTVETRLRRKDGEIINVLMSSTPLNPNDLTAGVTFTVLDITERKQAEEALKVSHERFLTVLESIDATIYVADIETYEILFMNKKMIESFGKNLTGEICWEVLGGESEPCRHCTNDQLVDEKHNPTGVCVWQGKNPLTNKWYINYDRAIEWTDGRLVKLQIATDITHLKKMEEELRQAHKMEAMGTLAGGIAHDFNNLLMGIQGRISLMSFDLLPNHPIMEHISAIEDYIRNAVDLTKQLLGLVRGGKYEVRPVDINDLLLTNAKIFGRTHKAISIHHKTHSGPLVVEADKSQIDQVLLNIFINAWQAMPNGGDLYLETSTVYLDEENSKPNQIVPGCFCMISVIDTGIGMDEATRQRIFDPFFTTKDKGRGTGLGLASAYGIVKNHGGIIKVKSELDHGTTFYIYLPLSEGEAPHETTVDKKMVTGTETVLIVDDEKMVLDVGKSMLKKLGYHVVIAGNGEQAVEIVADMKNEIDLVILDMIMPGMGGAKTFEGIRTENPSIPVILSSGYSINGQAQEIMNKGCNGFIQKPFNISELAKKIREVLDYENDSTQQKLSEF